MFYIFNHHGHFAEKMSVEPPILPQGYFYLEAADDLGEYLFSDGKTVQEATTPPPSESHIIQNGEWVLPNEREAAILEESKAEKIIKLNAAAQAFIDRAAGIDKIPGFEVQTWVIQAAEAKAWAADKSAPTPILDQIAASRGVPADALKQAALKKTIAYEQLTASITGQRQALQSKIESAKTKSALDKIKIEFKLPEAV
nr:MAG TPA: hypothetical protein [Caudoviricetes sp.]